MIMIIYPKNSQSGELPLLASPCGRPCVHVVNGSFLLSYNVDSHRLSFTYYYIVWKWENILATIINVVRVRGNILC